MASLDKDLGIALAADIADSYFGHLELDSNWTGNSSAQGNVAFAGYKEHHIRVHGHLVVDNPLCPVQVPLLGCRNHYVVNVKSHVLGDHLVGQSACLAAYSTVSAVAA